MWTNSSFVWCGAEFFMTGFFIFYLLLLPLFFFILYVGFQRWRKPRGSLSAITSHLDVFTYNAVVVEILGNASVGVYMSCVFLSCYDVVHLTVPVMLLCQNALTLFHMLSCVDRYLAVVHPVRYRGLTNRSGVRIRNLSIVGVWLICLLFLALHDSCGQNFCGYFYQMVPVGFSFLVVSFCCQAVLCALVGPKPGDVGGATRGRVDQSKRRAFYTVFAIMLALHIRFFAVVLVIVMFYVDPLSHGTCLVTNMLTAFHLPCSLVLPTLFLQRIRNKGF